MFYHIRVYIRSIGASSRGLLQCILSHELPETQEFLVVNRNVLRNADHQDRNSYGRSSGHKHIFLPPSEDNHLRFSVNARLALIPNSPVYWIFKWTIYNSDRLVRHHYTFLYVLKTIMIRSSHVLLHLVLMQRDEPLLR